MWPTRHGSSRTAPRCCARRRATSRHPTRSPSRTWRHSTARCCLRRGTTAFAGCRTGSLGRAGTRWTPTSCHRRRSGPGAHGGPRRRRQRLDAGAARPGSPRPRAVRDHPPLHRRQRASGASPHPHGSPSSWSDPLSSAAGQPGAAHAGLPVRRWADRLPPRGRCRDDSGAPWSRGMGAHLPRRGRRRRGQGGHPGVGRRHSAGPSEGEGDPSSVGDGGRAPRSDSATARLLQVLHEAPVLTARAAQRLLDTSFVVARGGLEELAEAGVLRREKVDRGTTAHLAGEVFDLLGHTERRLASTQWHTRLSPPVRPVPAPPC